MVEDLIYAADGSNIFTKRIRYKIRGTNKFQYRLKVTKVGEKRAFSYVKWSSKKNVTQKRLLEHTRVELKKRIVSIEPIKEKEVKKGLYRSAIIYEKDYPVGTGTFVNYTVWVYHELPNVTSSELMSKMNLMIDRYYTNMAEVLRSEGAKYELNVEIEEDEKPYNQDTNVFYGKGMFKEGTHVKEYPHSGNEDLGSRL